MWNPVMEQTDITKNKTTVRTVEVVKIDLCLYQPADLKILYKWTIKKTHWKITICRLTAISLKQNTQWHYNNTATFHWKASEHEAAPG